MFTITVAVCDLFCLYLQYICMCIKFICLIIQITMWAMHECPYLDVVIQYYS